MPHTKKIDLHAIDPRSLTPKQWDAVIRYAIDRAHTERARALRAMFRRLFGRSNSRKGAPAPCARAAR